MKSKTHNFPILSIDYGSKNIGLAYSDSKGIIASPLKVISCNTEKDMKSLISELNKIVQEYEIKEILVGLPQEFEINHSISTKKIQNFLSILKNNIEIPIFTYDESYSTQKAQRMLSSKGISIKRSKKRIDSFASAVFLQEFLNSVNKK